MEDIEEMAEEKMKAFRVKLVVNDGNMENSNIERIVPREVMDLVLELLFDWEKNYVCTVKEHKEFESSVEKLNDKFKTKLDAKQLLKG